MTPKELPICIMYGVKTMLTKWYNHVDRVNAFYTKQAAETGRPVQHLPHHRLFSDPQSEQAGMEAILAGVRYCIEDSFDDPQSRIGFNYVNPNDPSSTPVSLTSYQSILVPYARDIESPKDATPAYATEEARELLCFVFRQVAAHMVDMGRKAIVDPVRELPHISDIACDLTFSYLCYLYFNDAYADRDVSESAYQEVLSRAQYVDGCLLLQSCKFDSNGIYVGEAFEKQHLNDTVKKKLETSFSLDNVISGKYTMPPMVETSEVTPVSDYDDPVGNDILPSDFETPIPQDPSLTIDDNYIGRVESNSDEVIASAREAYYQKKDQDLSKQSDIKERMARLAKSIVFDTAPDVEINPSLLRKNSDTNKPIEEEDIDPVPHYDEEEEIMHNYPNPHTDHIVYSDNSVYPNTPMQQQPQQQYQQQQDPYVVTGQVNFNGRPTMVPQGKMLLVDCNAQPLTMANGNLTYVNIGEVDCRTIHRVSGPNNEPFCQEGMPFIVTKKYPNSQGEPLALSHSQQALLSNTIRHNQQPQYQQYQQSQPQYPQYQQPQYQQPPVQQQDTQVPVDKPWLRSTAVNEGQANQVFQDKSKQSTIDMDDDVTSPSLSNVYQNALKQHHKDDPASVFVKPVLDEDDADVEEDKPVLSGEYVFDNDVLVDIGECVIPMHEANNGRFRAVGKRSLEGQLTFDTRQFVVLVGMYKGYALEVLVKKESFMKREAHDPYNPKVRKHYVLDPSKGEVRADKIHDQIPEQSTPEKTTVKSVPLVISEESHEATVAVGMSFTAEHGDAVLANISERVAIPMPAIDRDVADDIIQAAKEEFGLSLYRLMMLPSLIRHYKSKAPAAANLINRRFSNWWEVMLTKRASVVDQNISVTEIDDEGVVDMVEYLKEEGIFEECIGKFNTEFPQLFNVEQIFIAPGFDSGLIDYTDSEEEEKAKLLAEARKNHTVESVGSDVEQVMTECRKRIMFVKTNIPCLYLPHSRAVINEGIITPENNSLLYSQLLGAFEKVTEGQSLIRVATAAGSYVTVARANNLGNEFVVIDKLL